jgi:hypothetical protein
MSEGVAFALHYLGPYARLTPDAPLALPGNCEDPGVYRERGVEVGGGAAAGGAGGGGGGGNGGGDGGGDGGGVFRMLLHCGCDYQLMYSHDGVQWAKQGTQRASGWCSGFNYTDGGGPKKLLTRQRPKWIVDQNGEATHLTTGVNRVGDSQMGHTWTMAARLVKEAGVSSDAGADADAGAGGGVPRGAGATGGAQRDADRADRAH